MFNITTIYPQQRDGRFDFGYYLNVHMPRSIALLSSAKGYRGVSVEQGVDAPDGRLNASYVAMCHYYFDTPEDFMNAFLPVAAELQGDIPNYTNIDPIHQINEVKIRE